jgi:multidrug resistance efflux pump
MWCALHRTWGLVTQVLVHDNQRVSAGQLLLVLDQPRFAAALEKADAAVSSARATLALARRESTRDNALGNLVASETRERNAAKVDTELAALAQARAEQRVAQLNVQRTEVRATTDGIVTNLDLHAGDYLQPGAQALALIDTGSLRIEGYFEETKLGCITEGDAAVARLMGDTRDVRGHVDTIAAGIADDQRSSTHNLLPAVAPTYTWVRLAQRIPVRIRIDDAPPDTRLIVGRTASVTITPSAQEPASERADSTWWAACPAAADDGLRVRPRLSPAGERCRSLPRAARAFVSGQEASFSHDAPPDRWWQLYGDPQLDAYVREALAANTDLRAADANLRRASATVLEYRARGAVQGTWMHRARSPMPVATPRRRPRRSRTRWASTSPIRWISQVASAAASKPPTRTRRRLLRHATRSAWSSLRPSPVPISRCAQAITRSLQPGRCWRYSAPRWRQPDGWLQAGAERTSMSAVPVPPSIAARRRYRTCWRNGRPHCSNWPH